MEGEGNMKTATIQLETLACPSCMLKIEGAVKGLEGVEQDSVKVLFNSSKAKVTFDESIVESKDIKKTIENLGFRVLGEK